mgnify:CR=1 FL=1
MNAIVNDSCISCGLCADTCPAVFHMGDDGMAHGPAEMLADAETARDGCPVGAISIEE